MLLLLNGLLLYAVPEFLIAGELSSVHILVDQFQLALIKDLLDHNLGEPLEEFERPESVIRDPVIPVSIWFITSSCGFETNSFIVFSQYLMVFGLSSI